jgi:hypothetical protein
VTFSRVKARGSGRLKWRLALGGRGEEFVSSRDMVGTVVDKTRLLGLDAASIKLGARADLMRATISADSCEVKIGDFGTAGLAGARAKVTAALGKRPQKTLYLKTSITPASVTLDVTDTAAFPSSGVVHIKSEAIAYTGKTSGTLTGCTRGYWGSVAQSHFIADGASLAYPKVTDVPESLEGRRAFFYVYGDGDDPLGSGTLRWRGIVSTGARFDRGVWGFTVDPITRLLDAEIGQGLNEPLPIRGIYYPVTAPFVLVLDNLLSTGDPNIDGRAVVKLTGFYNDQSEFCDELTTLIAAAIAAPLSYVGSGAWTWKAGSVITAQPDEDPRAPGFVLQYMVGTTGGVAPARVRVTVISGIDSSEAYPHYWLEDDGTGGALRQLAEITAPTAGHLYAIKYNAVVPRAAAGSVAPGASTYPPEFASIDPSDPFADSHFIYYGGIAVPTTDMVAVITNPTDTGPGNIIDITSISTALRRIMCECIAQRLGPETRITLPGAIARGTVEDFRQALIADSPTVCNLGALPLITSDDILALDLSEIVDSSALGQDRVFAAHPGTKLGDIVSAELLTLGCYQRINAGAIEWLRLRATVPTDAEVWTIVDADLMRDSWPSCERSSDGIVSSVLYKTAWDPIEDKWVGIPYTVRDVEAASSTVTGLCVEIAQRSIPGDATEAGVRPIDYDVVASMASPVLSLFGVEYDHITVQVGVRFFDAKIGDTVSLTSKLVPSTAGTLGVTDEICMVTGHGYDGSTNIVTLELLRSGQPVAGYAPSFRVTAQAGAGVSWTVTVNLSDYTDATDVSSWLTVGDLVRIYQADSAAPTYVDGTIASLPSATQIAIAFTGAWVPGASEWYVRPRRANDYASTDSLARFFFVASDERVITYSDITVTARVLSA